MKKISSRQMNAWLLAIFFTGTIATGAYFLTKFVAANAEKAELEYEFTEDDGHASPDEDAAKEDVAEKKDHGGGHEWGYEGSAGPEHWGELSEDFKACSAGNKQSPIDIAAPTPKTKLLPIKFVYKTSEVKLKNNGHSIQGDYEPGSYVEVDGEPYRLLQFHFHTPSEHKVNGLPYEMEIHLVHKNAKGALVVIGVLIESGDENKTLAALVAQLPRATDSESEGITFNIKALLPSKRSYYAYSGSLTTPPCSESVSWYVLTRPNEASDNQIESFASIMHHNARPVQTLHGREILKSKR